MVQRALDDPFCEEVFTAIPTEVRQSFTPEQRKAIKTAVAGVNKRHSIDVRFVLPLIFTQLYFVLLIGKDRRRDTVEVLEDRRRSLRDYSLVSLVTMFGMVLVVAVLGVLYMVKSVSGYEVFPDLHLKDFLRQMGL